MTNANSLAVVCADPAPLHSIQHSIDQLSGKWTLRVLFALWASPLRFGELRRSVPGVTKHMLTTTLRGLEGHGLVHREVLGTVPPQVRYSLTREGTRLQPVFGALIEWARRPALP